MIEYSYDYWLNSNPANNIFMWMFVGLMFALSIAAAVKKRLTLFLVLVFTLLAALTLDKYITSQRFIKLSPDNFEITLVNGSAITLNRKNIKRFWGVRHSAKGVTTGCYLWIQSKTGASYRSVNISNWKKCGINAKHLNELLNKY